MSCHEIGRGMNSVVRTVMTLKDDGKITVDVAKIIIKSCLYGVNWCDGNSYEARDYIARCTCGRCLKLVPKGEGLYSVTDTSLPEDEMWSLLDDFVNSRLCEKCFDEIIGAYYKDEKAGEREREYIKSYCNEEYYKSTGEYSDTNNGYRWD